MSVITRLDFNTIADGGDNATGAFQKLDANDAALDAAVAASATNIATNATAITNLAASLGTAATKNVGTASGTVAAADDTRFLAGTRGLKNLLMNSAARINNRRFAGGALGVGVFGYDRWKASQNGTSVTVTNGVWSLTGAVLQSIERDGSNVLDNRVVTISVEDPTGPVNVLLSGNSASVNGNIPAGAGRQSITLTMPATTNAYHGVVLSVTGTQTFKNPQLELGTVATPYEQRDITIEDLMCSRYCPSFRSTSILSVISMAQSATTTQTTPILRFSVRARVPPTSVVVSSGSHFSVSQPGTANVTCNSCVFGSASQDGAVLLTGGSTGLSVGSASILFFNNAAGWLYFEGCDF